MGFNLHTAGLVRLSKGTYVTSGRKETFEIMCSLANDCIGLETTSFEKKKSHQKVILGYFADRYRSRLKRLIHGDDESRNSFIKSLTKTEPDKEALTKKNLNKIFEKLSVSQPELFLNEFLHSKVMALHVAGHFSISSAWTEERLSLLESLWYQNKSIEEIGEELGISRNAVAGKAHRLNLPKRMQENGKPRWQTEKLDQEKSEFYGPAFDELAPATVMELIRVFLRKGLVQNHNPFNKRQFQENEEAFLVVIGVMEANRLLRDSLLNSYLTADSDWEYFKSNFPENLIADLPYPHSQTFSKIVQRARDKHGDNLKRFTKTQQASKQKNHEKVSTQVVLDNTPEEFQEQASLWLEGLERRVIARTKTSIKEIRVDPNSNAKPEALKRSSYAVPHPEYKQTLESSVAQTKNQNLNQLFESYERIKNTSTNTAKRMVEVEVRTQQGNFRKSVFALYKSTCCISGYEVEEALHAAHIVDYSETKDNSPQNGLCLRADIHILFDKGLIKIDCDYSVEVDRQLEDTQYWQYNGQKILLPLSQIDWPKKSNLEMKYRKFPPNDTNDKNDN